MDVSLYLAQLLGLYFIIAGLIVAGQQKSLMEAVRDFERNRALVLVVALVELVAGIAIVLGNPSFSYDWMGIITLIGAWMIVEAVLYFIMPFPMVKRFIRYFNRKPWYSAGSLVSVVIGVYLAGSGFGWFY